MIPDANFESISYHPFTVNNNFINSGNDADINFYSDISPLNTKYFNPDKIREGFECLYKNGNRGRNNETMSRHQLKRAERETLSLKSFGNSSGNLHTMFFILDFMYHFIRGESNHTKILKCFIILCPRLSETFSFRLYR